MADPSAAGSSARAPTRERARPAKRAREPWPAFATPIVETHCHLDYLEGEGLEALLADARSRGVAEIVTIAVSPENLATVREIVATHDGVYGTQGIHPHEAGGFDDGVAQEIRTALAQRSDLVAVGEIGLDYFYEHAPRAAQLAAFERQLQIAVDLELPIVVHSREADEDTRAVLGNFTGALKAKGVIHSFTSGLPLAEWCLGEGFKLGFNGITTFNKADNVREVVQITPTEQLVLETDAPYLTPVPYRGKPNAPCYLPFIAEYLADYRGEERESFLRRVRENSLALFPRLRAAGASASG
ncbi:MAG: TatD family hydrolase [Pseudomonadota bacterium]